MLTLAFGFAARAEQARTNAPMSDVEACVRLALFILAIGAMVATAYYFDTRKR